MLSFLCLLLLFMWPPVNLICYLLYFSPFCRFVDMSAVYAPALRSLAESEVGATEAVAVLLPTCLTNSERQAAKALGGSVVGITFVLFTSVGFELFSFLLFISSFFLFGVVLILRFSFSCVSPFYFHSPLNLSPNFIYYVYYSEFSCARNPRHSAHGTRLHGCLHYHSDTGVRTHRLWLRGGCVRTVAQAGCSGGRCRCVCWTATQGAAGEAGYAGACLLLFVRLLLFLLLLLSLLCFWTWIALYSSVNLLTIGSLFYV